MSNQVQFITKEVFAKDSAAIIQQEPDENTQEAIDSSNDGIWATRPSPIANNM